MPKHTLKVKKAFKPMPGACAKGTFAIRAVNSVPTAAERQVVWSMPVWERRSGFTKMM